MSINDDVLMFYNAMPHIFERAKMLRKNMISAEKLLWEELKGKKILGLRFRAQHPIYIFIADFYCHPVKLVIEVDGGIHKSREQKEYDLIREGELNDFGIEVIRFSNEEVEQEIKQVINKIITKCKELQSKLILGPLQGL